MQLSISSQHIEVTPSLKQHIEQRFAKIQHHFEKMTEVIINMRIEKKRHGIEATILVSGQKLFAHADSDDMYASIDLLIHKLDRQVLKHKEKIKNHHNKDVTHHIPNR